MAAGSAQMRQETSSSLRVRGERRRPGSQKEEARREERDFCEASTCLEAAEAQAGEGPLAGGRRRVCPAGHDVWRLPGAAVEELRRRGW